MLVPKRKSNNNNKINVYTNLKSIKCVYRHFKCVYIDFKQDLKSILY